MRNRHGHYRAESRVCGVRSFLLIFTGARHPSTVLLGIGDRERFAVLTFTALILGGGFFPQPGVSTRHRAAAAILVERRKLTGSGLELSIPPLPVRPETAAPVDPAQRP